MMDRYLMNQFIDRTPDDRTYDSSLSLASSSWRSVPLDPRSRERERDVSYVLHHEAESWIVMKNSFNQMLGGSLSRQSDWKKDGPSMSSGPWLLISLIMFFLAFIVLMNDEETLERSLPVDSIDGSIVNESTGLWLYHSSLSDDR